MGKYDPTPPVCWSICAEKQRINVYGVYDDDKVIYPFRVPSTLVPDRHVDLLLFERDGVQHYTTIRDFSRLVGRQLSNHGHAVHCCRHCLHAYSSQELLDAHALDCCHAQRTKFHEDPRCPFTNTQKQHCLQYMLTLNRSYNGSTTKQWILHRVLQQVVAMNQ